ALTYDRLISIFFAAARALQGGGITGRSISSFAAGKNLRGPHSTAPFSDPPAWGKIVMWRFIVLRQICRQHLDYLHHYQPEGKPPPKT
ncbi:MAG: hypothetical protein ABFD21_03090, partial [Anaerolineaceae bacterium]